MTSEPQRCAYQTGVVTEQAFTSELGHEATPGEQVKA